MYVSASLKPLNYRKSSRFGRNAFRWPTLRWWRLWPTYYCQADGRPLLCAYWKIVYLSIF